MFDSISNAAPQVKAGKLRALAVLTPTRSPLMPDVPTAKEQGFEGLDFPAWIGLFAPANTPREVVVATNKALVAAMAQADSRDRLLQSGLIPAMVMEGDFAKLLVTDQKTVADLVRKANIPQQ
jgi:tripartite-type tricarboxylate transporter receptor subunit TctC